MRRSQRRQRVSVHDALHEVQRDRWQCQTCRAPAQIGKPHCLPCEIYWEDVQAAEVEAAERADQARVLRAALEEQNDER